MIYAQQEEELYENDEAESLLWVTFSSLHGFHKGSG